MTDIDVSLLDVGFRAVYAREGWIPLAAGEDGTILVGASRELDPAQEEAIADDLGDRKSTRLNSSHTDISRMPSSA